MSRENKMFDGETYDQARDGERLKTQLDRVKEMMLDGEWRTLHQIAAHVGGSEAGVSARLRDLRKEKHGSYDIERSNSGGGVWYYRMVPKRKPTPVSESGLIP